MGHDLCVVDCVRDSVLFAVPQPIEWQRIGNQIERITLLMHNDMSTQRSLRILSLAVELGPAEH